MLARPAELPLGSGYAYEVKWDGFRAIVSTIDGLRVRSRRGWDMTARVPELTDLPEGLVLDGELIALGDDGLPSFPRLSNRILHGHEDIHVTFVIFDVLAQDGESTMELPYAKRRGILEQLNSPGRRGTRLKSSTTVRLCSRWCRRRVSRASSPSLARAHTVRGSADGRR